MSPLYSITTPGEHVAMIIERFDEDDVPIKVGLRKQVNQKLTNLDFRTYATLQSVDPDAWSAEVQLFGQKIVETEATFSSKYDAASAADGLVVARLVALLRRDPSDGESRPS